MSLSLPAFQKILKADLLEIATQVNAKALNVPLSINFYKPKPYAYLNFSSFDTFEAAKEMTVAFLDDHLDKLYSRFNAGSRRGHQDLRQSCDKSNSRSRSRSNSRSRNLSSSSRSNNSNNRINNTHPNTSRSNNQTISNNNNNIPSINDYSFGSIQPPPEPHLYPPHDDQETHSYDNGWDDVLAYDTNSGFNLPPYTLPSLMDTSPDASFSALDPNSVLSRRHVPLPNSRPTIIAPDANASRLQLEISNVTNTQKNLSAQLGSIMDKLDSFSFSKPSPSND
ncbi:hypothetical protein RhiirC2_801016 [Rhizophagus irregularis]|uniref:Uncharacterized protein n=1 Tax=Rhizophagus irregularis TaxID=588596 RepID=A0A2N1M2Y2_9GLOM|nr:hypothetical protein RhiirC2_801016 [Rhizophagus irregularis]